MQASVVRKCIASLPLLAPVPFLPPPPPLRSPPSPFPSSEIYRTLPVRDEILRALLNADLLGFHTFDYARHFLSCCSRMLGLEYESRRGHIGLDYYGRTVGIKIMPVGVHMGRLAKGLALADTEWRSGELRAQYDGRRVVLGVDDMDLFKGIGEEGGGGGGEGGGKGTGRVGVRERGRAERREGREGGRGKEGVGVARGRDRT